MCPSKVDKAKGRDSKIPNLIKEKETTSVSTPPVFFLSVGISDLGVNTFIFSESHHVITLLVDLLIRNCQQGGSKILILVVTSAL